MPAGYATQHIRHVCCVLLQQKQLCFAQATFQQICYPMLALPMPKSAAGLVSVPLAARNESGFDMLVVNVVLIGLMSCVEMTGLNSQTLASWPAACRHHNMGATQCVTVTRSGL